VTSSVALVVFVSVVIMIVIRITVFVVIAVGVVKKREDTATFAGVTGPGWGGQRDSN